MEEMCALKMQVLKGNWTDLYWTPNLRNTGSQPFFGLLFYSILVWMRLKLIVLLLPTIMCLLQDPQERGCQESTKNRCSR